MGKEKLNEKGKLGVAAALATAPLEFVVARVGDKYVRFQGLKDVPEGTPSENVHTVDSVAEMPKEALGELYGGLAGVSPKNFKDRRVAIESIAYQVSKMRTFDPDVPEPKIAGVSGTPNEKNRPPARKSKDNFELLQPADAERLLRDTMPPQQREVVAIIVDLAASLGRTSFTRAELTAYISKPEVAVRLNTKQEPIRIFQYYQGSLATKGFLKIS